ncbi:MAG: type II toxin-antitoxin system HicB family antitoxin [Chloroflexi bacterium]|nr:type II toxin-antitoxin system HicB family antitoxin [Chloroflexota bacterium]
MDTITIRLTKNGDWFVSHCLDYDIASQGETSQEAIENIKEAVSLFLEYASPDEVERCLEEQGRIQQLSLHSA